MARWEGSVADRLCARQRSRRWLGRRQARRKPARRQTAFGGRQSRRETEQRERAQRQTARREGSAGDGLAGGLGGRQALRETAQQELVRPQTGSARAGWAGDGFRWQTVSVRDGAAGEGSVADSTPYTTEHERRVKFCNEGCMQITVWRNRKPLEGKVGEKTQDGTVESWFKIKIPYGRKYDKTWLMNSIQSRCSVPFTPVDFHYVRSWAYFFVQDASTAIALKDISYKICNEENQKIPIFVNTSNAPYSVRNKLGPKEMEQLKLTMNKRYDVSLKVLDLQSLRYDRDLVNFDIDIILNRRNCMVATLRIIKENFPELLSLNLCNNKLYRLDGLSDLIQVAPTVKILNLSRNEFSPHISQLNSAFELANMKGLKLEELWLDGNPLCSTFPDQSTYISAIKNCFPKLLCLASYRGPEATKTLVMQFLKEYYYIYDYGDRQSLLGAYHDEACFSLTIPFNTKDPDPSSLFEYFKDNRNMKSLKDPYLRVQKLKYTKHDIVCSLCVLPKTQHDLLSFVVDMWFQTEMMLCFSVNGLFKEVEGSSQGSVRAFSRTFITIPASSSGIFIMNDELFVRDATPNETQSAFSIDVPAPISSSWPTLSQAQEMAPAFSTQSGMSFQYPQK
ncbi:nuclear RNA export factor 2-like [Hipposideros larvatus]